MSVVVRAVRVWTQDEKATRHREQNRLMRESE